jgi:hypothetical protein
MEALRIVPQEIQNMKFVFSWLRNQVVLALGTLLVILLSVLQFNLAPTQAQPQTLMQLDAPPQEITEGWQYYWGDFPLNEAGVPVWTQEKISSLGWHPFQFPKRLWKQPRQAIVWLRVPLPSGQWQSPALYLRAVLHENVSALAMGVEGRFRQRGNPS